MQCASLVCTGLQGLSLKGTSRNLQKREGTFQAITPSQWEQSQVYGCGRTVEILLLRHYRLRNILFLTCLTCVYACMCMYVQLSCLLAGDRFSCHYKAANSEIRNSNNEDNSHDPMLLYNIIKLYVIFIVLKNCKNDTVFNYA